MNYSRRSRGEGEPDLLRHDVDSLKLWVCHDLVLDISGNDEAVSRAHTMVFGRELNDASPLGDDEHRFG